MKIYDCFTFYNELEILELRLNLLAPYVDYFVLVESNLTYRGENKELIFEKNKNRFSKFSSKIIYLKMLGEVQKILPNDFTIESTQRNYIKNGLNGCEPDDIIIVSDIDEIPNPRILKKIREQNFYCKDNLNKLHRVFRKRKEKVIAYIKYIGILYKYFKNASVDKIMENTPVVCSQRHYYYFMNYLHHDEWCGSVFSLYKNMKSPQNLRDLRRRLPIINNGGWHFAYMGGISRILTKINSTVDETPNALQNQKYNESYVKEHIERGSLMYGYQDKEKNLFKLIKNEEIGIQNIDKFANRYPYLFWNEMQRNRGK